MPTNMTITGPGDEMWCELDYQAVEFAVGHPVERERTKGDAKIDVSGKASTSGDL